MLRRIVLGFLLATVSFATGCSAVPPSCNFVLAGLPADRVVPETGAPIPAGAVVLARSADVDWAASRLSGDQAVPSLDLQLLPGREAGLVEFTAQNVGGFMVLALNDQVVSAPMIQSAIEGGAVTVQSGGLDGSPEAFAAFEACLPS